MKKSVIFKIGGSVIYDKSLNVNKDLLANFPHHNDHYSEDYL